MGFSGGYSGLHFVNQMDNSQLRSGANEAKGIFKGLAGEVGGITAGIFGFVGAKELIGEVVRVRGEFQKYEAVLANTLNSERDASKEMAMIADYAAKTNFQVGELTDGYIRLTNNGFQPSRKEMEKLGDLAASKAKGFQQLSEAILDAQTFEFERLKEFGIRASKDGDKITFTFKGIKTEVKATSDAVKDYIVSLGGLQGVKGSTDAISKTFVGQVSNLGDAVDKMLNKIGQSNEGLIYSGIQGANSLVSNYQTIAEVLKGLIVVYGAAKVAMMIVNHEKKVAAAANLLMASSTEAMSLAEAKAAVRKTMLATAQSNLNKSMLANPYVLAAAAVAALGYGLYKLATYQTEAEKAVKAFNAEIIKEKDKVDTLFAALKAAKEGTDQYKTAKEALFSAYGQYIPEQLKELKNLQDIEAAQKAVNVATREAVALKSRDEAITKITEEYSKPISSAQTNIYEKIKDKSGVDVAMKARLDLEGMLDKIKGGTFDRQKDVLAFFREYGMINESNNGVSNKGIGISVASDLSTMLNNAVAAQGQIKSVYDETGKYISEAAKREVEAKKERIAQIDKEIDGLVKQQKALQENSKGWQDLQTKIDALNKEKGVQAEVKNENYWKKQVDEIKSQISALDSTASDFEKKKSELQKQLDKNQAELDKFDVKGKDKKDQDKADTDRLEKQKDIARKEIELKKETESSKIALMKEGAAKQIALAKSSYDAEIARIAQSEQDYLDTLNKGLKPGEKGYAKALPDNIKSQIDSQRANAETKLNSDIVAINKDAADQVKEIWKSATSQFLTDQGKEVQDINDKYVKLFKEAKQAGASFLEIVMISIAKMKELNESSINNSLRNLANAEETELQKAEISIDGFNLDNRLEKQKLEIVRRYAQKRIDILKTTGNESDKNEIERLELFIKATNIGLKNLNDKNLADSVNKIRQMVDGMKAFSDEVFGVDSVMSSMLHNSSEYLGIIESLSLGDYAGATTGILQTIAGWYQQTVTSAEELAEAEKRTRQEAININDLYRERLNLLESLGLISPMESFTLDVEALNQKLATGKEALKDYQQNFLLNGKQTSATIKQIFDTVFGDNWGAKELSTAMDDWDVFFEEYLKIVGGKAFTNHPLSGFNWIMDKEQFNKDLNYILSTASEIENAIENFMGFTRDDMATSISDGIFEGLKLGEDGLGDFAESFGELMKKYSQKSLADFLNEKYLQNIYEKAYEFAKSNGIDDTEFKILQGLYSDAIKGGQAYFESFKKLINPDGIITSLEPLKGQMTAASEESVSLLYGQLTALRVDNKDNNAVMRSGNEIQFNLLEVATSALGYQKEIAENTRHNKHLVTIDNEIREMHSTIRNKL